VEPINDLDSLGRPLPNPLGIEATAIAANDLDARARLQPPRDRGGRAYREQINDLMAFEIADHGPEPSASPPALGVKMPGPITPSVCQEAKRDQVGQELVYKHTMAPSFLQMSPHSSFQANALKACHTPRSPRMAQTPAPLIIWDSLIWVTAKLNDVSNVLSEDFNDGAL
jgi:hypothetical protein